jgi:hypothetical protein
MQSVDIVIQARDEASKQFGAVGKSALNLGNIVRTAAIAIGGYFSARSIVDFVKSSVEAYRQQELAITHLTSALSVLGITDRSAITDLRNFANEIQRTTTIHHDAVIETMSLGAAMGKFSGDTLKAATVAAVGFSKAFKIDLDSAMKLVAKSAEGITTGLKRYGIQIDTTKSSAEIFHDVLARGAQLYEVANDEIKTQQGSIAQLSNAWKDLKEGIGGAVSNYLTKFIEGLLVGIVIIRNWRLGMDIAWTSAKLGLVSFWEDTKHFFGTVMPELFSWFANNWRDVFTDIWNATKAIFTNMGTNIKDFFTAVWHYLKGEGFNFKWTGLLEGFQSTLKELPVIAQRELSKTEIALKEQLGKLTTEMAEKIVDEFEPKKLDIKGILEKAVYTGLEKPEKETAKGQYERLAAIESRFMAFGPGTRFNQTEKNTGDTASNTSRIADLLETTNEKLDDMTSAIQNGQQIEVSDMA